MSIPTLWIVIPCYNEEDVLPITIPLFSEELNLLKNKNKINKNSKILFVNDGSTDATEKIIKNCCERDTSIALLSLKENCGHQKALFQGLVYARMYCDVTISIDCDGQDDIRIMEEMIDCYLSGSEIVYAVRNDRQSDSFFKKFSAEMFYKISSLLKTGIIFNHADYRLTGKKALNELEKADLDHLCLRKFFPSLGFSEAIVTYKRESRIAGESHYHFLQMLKLAINGLFDGKAIYQKITSLIYVLSFLLLFWLLLWAGFETSFIDVHEKTVLLPDSFFWNLVFSILIPTIGFVTANRFFQKQIYRINTDKKLYRFLRMLILLLSFVFLFVFVITSKKIPRADQREICYAVNCWRNHDNFPMQNGGYLNVYPSQSGIVVLLYLLSFIIGDNNYIALQILNAVILVFIHKTVADIWKIHGGSNTSCLFLLMASVLFMPLGLYTTFIYGTLAGLLFSLLSFKHFMIYSGNDSGKDIVLFIFFSSLAIMVKPNYLIFSVGLLSFVLLRWLKTGNICAILFCFIGIILPSIITPMSVLMITNEFPKKGASKYGWVAMGLQKNDLLYDGWFNNYNEKKFIECDYNPERHEIASKTEIMIWLNNTDWKEKAEFLSRKNRSQWNNPTFQGIWVNQVMKGHRIPLIDSENRNKWLIQFLNYYQFFILFGSILYLFSENKEDDFLLFFIVFIGGFLFHTFWEAKCQYTMPYFYLLIPVSIKGWMSVNYPPLASQKRGLPVNDSIFCCATLATQ